MAKRNKSTKKGPFWLKVVISLALIITISGGIAAFRLYHAIFESNVYLGGEQSTHIYIPTGSDFEDVQTILSENGLLINPNTFSWLAEKKNYKDNIRPGRYLIAEDMSNNRLINMLRSGDQDPVRLTFNNIRLKEQLAGVMASNIEADSTSIINLLNDEIAMEEFGFNPQTSKLLFIPNTYEIFWNTSAEQLIERMYREYNSFWNRDRIAKAEEMNMTPVQVAILASIVQMETSRPDEFRRIAGVFINRLRRNIPLQADPTVIFAVGDFTIRRVLNRHLAVDSPYNTYRYRGLPPGPISVPEPRVIDAVLNYEKHGYIFFAAREDFSGYHAFAETYREHRINARRFHNALNQRGIMR